MQVQSIMKHFLSAICLGVFLFFGWVNSAYAQNPTPPTDDQVNAVARQLYCPVCENTPLDVCGTQACAQWRELIRQKLAVGWNETQIKQYFVQQYGDRVLAIPPPHGINWLAYLVPAMLILAGVIYLWRVLSGWQRPPRAQETPSSLTSSDEYIARVEEELKKR